MKRDQSISLTYLPPRVRVVETYSDQGILSDSRNNFSSTFSVDETENVNANGGVEGERYYFDNF